MTSTETKEQTSAVAQAPDALEDGGANVHELLTRGDTDETPWYRQTHILKLNFLIVSPYFS